MSLFNPTTPGSNRLVNHTLKTLQHLLQDFKPVFGHFVNTRRYRVKGWLRSHIIV